MTSATLQVIDLPASSHLGGRALSVQRNNGPHKPSPSKFTQWA